MNGEDATESTPLTWAPTSRMVRRRHSMAPHTDSRLLEFMEKLRTNGTESEAGGAFSARKSADLAKDIHALNPGNRPRPAVSTAPFLRRRLNTQQSPASAPVTPAGAGGLLSLRRVDPGGAATSPAPETGRGGGGGGSEGGRYRGSPGKQPEMKRNSSFTEHLAKRRPSLLADHIIRGLEHGAASPVNAIPPPINTSSSKSPMSTRRASSPLSMPQSPHTPTTPLTPHTPTTPITPMEGEWTAVDEQGSGSSDENKIDTDDDDGAHTVNIGAESDDENESKFSNRAVNRKLENISPVQVRFPTREHARGNGAAGRYGGWVGWERDNVWWRVDGGRCHTGKSGGGPLWGVPAAVTGAAQTALIRTLTHSTYTRHSAHVLNSWIGVSALSYPSNSFPTPLSPLHRVFLTPLVPRTHARAHASSHLPHLPRRPSSSLPPTTSCTCSRGKTECRPVS